MLLLEGVFQSADSFNRDLDRVTRAEPALLVRPGSPSMTPEGVPVKITSPAFSGYSGMR